MLRKLQVIAIFCVFIFTNLCVAEKRADLVIYSFDRPMQLFALLESVNHYMTGLGEIIVIYRSSSDDFSEAYKEVVGYFPEVEFVMQGANPRDDFKPLTLRAVFDSSNDYIIFAVDDIIVKDFIDVADDIERLERYNAYGFFYRLGLHLSYCYTRACDQPVPLYELLENDLCAWSFKNGKYNWGYPHTVDMTLYRKKDIKHDMATMSYNSPNTFEGRWSSKAKKIMDRSGLFYKLSKIVNLPLNRVQNDCTNIHMNALSSQELLELFNQGLKIDIFPLFRIKNNGAHMEYFPTFIKK